MRSLVAVAVSLVAVSSSAEVRIAADAAQVQTQLHLVKSCWERFAREEPIPSKATLEIDVDEEGAVTRVAAEPLPSRLVACISGRVRNWRFPTGGARQLSYPLLLINASEPAPR